jgi:hypothetical protein
MNHHHTAVTKHTRVSKGQHHARTGMNIFGDKVKQQPEAAPVDWAAPVVTFTNGKSANAHAHSDRLWQADANTYNKVSQELFGDQSQLWWDSRTPAQVERFLRAYLDKPNLVLVEIQKMYNRSNGGPVWGFSYHA